MSKSGQQGSWKCHRPLDHNLTNDRQVTENFDKFEFGVVGHISTTSSGMSLRTGTLDDYGMLYSDNEEEKVITRSVLLYTSLDKILRLLHPITPACD